MHFWEMEWKKLGSPPWGTPSLEGKEGRCYLLLRGYFLPGPHAKCFPCSTSFHNHNSVRMKVLPPFYRGTNWGPDCGVTCILKGASLVAQMGKNLPANAGDGGSIPGLGKSPWSRSWQPTLFLPGESHGQRSLVGYSPWGHKESKPTEWLSKHTIKTVVVPERMCLAKYLHL